MSGDSHCSSLTLEEAAVVFLQATDVAHCFAPDLLQHHQWQLCLGLLHCECETQDTHRTTETSNPYNIKKKLQLEIYFNWLVNHFNNVCSRNELTDCVDFVGKLSGAEGAGVRGDTLVEQVDDVAVPASLCEGGNNQQPHDTCRCELTQCCLSMRKVKHVPYTIKTFKMSH